MAETNNIGKRILEILKEKKIKPTPLEDELAISRGYIKRSADNDTGLGSEIVEKILLKFPDINAYWLITGLRLQENTDEKITSVSKPTELWLRRPPDFLAEDPKGEEKVREATQWRIYYLEQDKLLRDKIIADLRERLKKAGIPDNTEHDFTV